MNFNGGVKDGVVIGSQEGNFFICLKTPSKVLSYEKKVCPDELDE
jgi:hypothetical protein